MFRMRLYFTCWLSTREHVRSTLESGYFAFASEYTQCVYMYVYVYIYIYIYIYILGIV